MVVKVICGALFSRDYYIYNQETNNRMLCLVLSDAKQPKILRKEKRCMFSMIYLKKDYVQTCIADM